MVFLSNETKIKLYRNKLLNNEMLDVSKDLKATIQYGGGLGMLWA